MGLLKKTMIYPSGDFEEEKYNLQGQLIKKSTSNSEHEYEYDESNKIVKEIINRFDKISGDNIIEFKQYEYSNSDYRILTYSKKKYNIYNTDPFTSIKKWENIDELIKINEYKFINNKLSQEKIINLEQNINKKSIFKYNEFGNKSSEIKFVDNLLFCEYEFDYNEDKLVSVDEFRIFDGKKYLAFKSEYEYNEKGDQICHREYGIYNSKMVLFLITKTIYIGNYQESIFKEYSFGWDYSVFLGHYNHDAMIKYVYKLSAEKDTDDSDNSFYLDYIDYLTVDLFEKNEYSTEKYVKKFDKKGNLIGKRIFYLNNNSNIEHNRANEILINSYNEKEELERVCRLEIYEDFAYKQRYEIQYQYS